MTKETNQVDDTLAFYNVTDLARRLGGHITVFDLETTTFRGQSNFGIMEVACFTVTTQGPGLKFGSLINPERSISPDASRITGLTTRDVIGAETWGKRYAGLFAKLAQEQWLTGFNSKTFDCYAVKDMGKRYGHPIEEFKKAFDVKDLNRILSAGKIKGSLEAVAAQYGVYPRGALHRAGADVALTLELLNAIIEVYGLDAVCELILPKQEGTFDKLSAHAVARYVKSRKKISLEQIATAFGKDTEAVSFEISKAIDERLIDASLFASPEAQAWLDEALPEVDAAVLTDGRLRPLYDALAASAPKAGMFDYIQLRVALLRAGLTWSSLKQD